MKQVPFSLDGEPPTTKDLRALEHESWIDKGMAAQARIYRVDRTRGAELVGRQAHREDCSGLVFPLINPITGYLLANILRRDNPDIVYEGGKPKTRGKYIMPPGGANHLYFAPGTPAEHLSNVEIPLVITEGAKKALCLDRLSRHGLGEAAELPRFLPVALMGVWNWRGKTGHQPGPNVGDKQIVKGPIPDLDWITWAARKVIILFDSDAATNPMIQAAINQLTAELQFRGAVVSIAKIPERTPAKLGIDDFVIQYGAAEALAIISKPEAAPVDDESSPEKKQTALFKRILLGVEFFKSPEGKHFAQIPVDTHRETVNVRSSRFRTWLTGSFFRIARTVPTSQKIVEALQFCEFRAEHDGDIEEVHFRVAGYNTGDDLSELRVYIDLGDTEWHAIEIDGTGWRIVTNPPVKFRRSPGMMALPWPVPGGELDELRPFLNAQEDEVWVQMLSWLIGVFNPKGPYPILLLQGEQGTAKSTQARLLRSIIDPAIAPARSTPREERDLVIGASNAWVMSYDNMSGCPHWLSDALCRISTGGGFATRQLHTDQEEIVFNSCRPIVLNGIDDIAANGDLADRSITVNLPVIEPSRRRTEGAFWAEFATCHARILGAVLTAVAGAIRGRAKVKLSKLPRMADFALWVAGAAQAGTLPFSQADFESIYNEQASAASAVLFDASPVAKLVRDYMADRMTASLSPSDLLDVLARRATDDVKKSKQWPKNAAWLSRQLKRMAPIMRSHGIDIVIGTTGHAKTRIVQITYIGDRAKETAENVPSYADRD